MYVISRLSQSCIQYEIDIIILLDMVNRLAIWYGYKYHSLVLSMVGYLEMYLGVHFGCTSMYLFLFGISTGS